MLTQRDIGLNFVGKGDSFLYGVGLFQGQGQNEIDRNGGKTIVGRFVYKFTPNLELGASGQLGTFRPESSASDLLVRRAGLELSYTKGFWNIEGEYIWGDGYNLFRNGESESRGFYLYNTFSASPKLDFVLGYDKLDPAIGESTFLISDDSQNARDRFTIGVNYYLSREPVHRILLNYEQRRELEGPGASGSGFRLRYQYSW